MHVSDDVERSIRKHDFNGVVSKLWNDFDPIVSGALVAVQEAKRLLMEHGAENAMLSGSGSAVFGVFAAREVAQSAASQLNGMFQRIFVARSLGREVEG